MSDFDANFDRQKLIYHPREVSHWLEHGVTRGPIYTEMTLCNRCNCKCIFCGVDHQLNKTESRIDFDLALKTISGLHELGNKSIMFSGDGEPLLHPRVKEIIAFAAERMSCSMTTNGLSLDEDALPLLRNLEWIRFSISGGTAENYALVQGTQPEMFDRVLTNVRRAVEWKRETGIQTTLGTQLVLIEENAGTVVALARILKDLGVDYFSVKPYSQHPLSGNRHVIEYSRFESLEKELRPLETDTFRIIYRSGSMGRVRQKKPYDQCFGTHFLCFVSTNGDIWECNVFAGDPRFRIGNVREESLESIWNGPRRKEVLAFIADHMDLNQCRELCRMDECNRYLWRLKHPWPHDAFI